MATETLFKSAKNGKGAELVGNYDVENPQWVWFEDRVNFAAKPLEHLIDMIDEQDQDDGSKGSMLIAAYKFMQWQLKAVVDVLEEHLGQIQVVNRPDIMSWHHVDPEDLIGIETVDFSGKHQQTEQGVGDDS